MAKFLRHPKTNKIVRIEIPAKEMAESVLGVEVESLAKWKKAIPPARGEGENAIYAVKSRKELQLYKKRAALLRTQMTEQAVFNVERAGLLDAYAALAEDCPAGITAHMWRSYGLVVLMQARYGKMIGAEELARRAGMVKIDENGEELPDVEMAAKHLRVLNALGYLTKGQGEWEGQWQHQGLPKAWRGG